MNMSLFQKMKGAITMISMRELERFLNKARVKKYIDEKTKSIQKGLKRLEEQSYVKVKVKK